MQTILDLDLDVFSFPRVTCPHSGYSPPDEEYEWASSADVRYFLEHQCGLSRENRIAGAEFRDHDEAFLTWKRWIKDEHLVRPFAIIHVDAHADMGIGDSGYLYLLSQLLALPVEQRQNPRRGSDALNLGNYLMFAIANRWVNRLTYVFPTFHPWTANWQSSSFKAFEDDREPDDLMVMHFRGGDWKTGLIELKHCSRPTLDRCVGRAKLEPIIYTEPAVPFAFTALPNFNFKGFTHMVVAHSPQYAPPGAGELLPIIREYFNPR